MSCAQARRDAVRGDAVSPDGVAGQGLGVNIRVGGWGEEEGRRAGGCIGGRRGQKDPHIWNHFRSAQALAVKGETGRLAGERGTGVSQWTYHSQGSAVRKTTNSRKENGLRENTNMPLFNVASEAEKTLKSQR